MKPSIACVDPATNHETCSCTCTNGIKFDQPLDPFSYTANGGSGPGLANNSACQADKDLLMAKIKDLEDDQQKHLAEIKDLKDGQQEYIQREKGLSEELSICKGKPFVYQGCYTDGENRVLADGLVKDSAMTVEKCASICKNYMHYGVQNGNACLCGKAFKQPTAKVAEGECNQNCSGNAKQKCGGPWKNSLYSRTI